MLIALNGISKSYQASHGAPPYQVLKDGVIHLDEREVVADALKERASAEE